MFLFSSPAWNVTRFGRLCLAAPFAKTPFLFPSFPYFQPSATPYPLELSEVSLYFNDSLAYAQHVTSAAVSYFSMNVFYWTV